MKRAWSVALIPIICFLLGMTSITTDLNKPAMCSEKMGYLYDDEGHCLEIKGRPINTFIDLKGPYHADADITVTYLYVIDGSAFAKTEDGSRPGSFLKLYLINKYNQEGDLDVLTSVSGNWKVEDAHTSVCKASLVYMCRGSGAMEQYGETSVENDFLIDTGFTERVYAAASAVGSRLTLELLVDGSETWTFTVDNLLEYPEKIIK